MPSTKDFIMEAAPAAQVAVKKNKSVCTQFRMSLTELDLLFMVLKGRKCLEEELRNGCIIIGMFILVKN
jgi:hypothetical protein